MILMNLLENNKSEDSILRQLLLFIPLLLLLQWCLQLKGIILAQPLCDFICGMIGILMILYTKKRSKTF
ncbi:hypothetical protein [Absiella sp. AM29-15]|uniref:hypothetical protein n=1 Tax=Absiella sp. AM29-15 TaxID=2292278 RepID=UPI001F375166|nr:hypothetical protein [Absiella sp. AM29-15]